MKRLWYVDIQRRDDAFLLQAANVFDGGEVDEPVSAHVADPLDVEAILRALKPFARISRRYMEINALSSLLRIASLPTAPLEDLLAHVFEDLPSQWVLITPFLTHEEVVACLRLRDARRE